MTAPTITPPPPLDDSEIEAAAKRLAACMDYPWEFMPEKGRENMRQHARAIVGPAAAARDAQWSAMIGEPVAYRVEVDGLWFHARDRDGLITALGVKLGISRGDLQPSPLYAIKETP